MGAAEDVRKFQARIALLKTKTDDDGNVYGGLRVRFPDGTEKQFSVAMRANGECAVEEYAPDKPKRRIVTLDDLKR